MHAHFFIIMASRTFQTCLYTIIQRICVRPQINLKLLNSKMYSCYSVTNFYIYLSKIIIRNCLSSIKAFFIVLNDLLKLNQNIHLLLTTQPMTGRQLYTVYFVLCMYCLLFTLYCVLGTVYCILCIVYFVLCTVFYVLYTVYCLLCTAYCVLYTVYCVLCTVYCVLYTVYCILFTVYCLLCTI